jgi:hypothetical protein
MGHSQHLRVQVLQHPPVLHVSSNTNVMQHPVWHSVTPQSQYAPSSSATPPQCTVLLHTQHQIWLMPKSAKPQTFCLLVVFTIYDVFSSCLHGISTVDNPSCLALCCVVLCVAGPV